MKTPSCLLAVGLVAAFASSSCDRRDMAENQPTPQPSGTTDAPAAPDAYPSGEPQPPAATPMPDTATNAPAATAMQDDAVALGWLAAVNEHEIAAAKQAKGKGVKGDVLAFANTMEKDHGTNLAQTRALGNPTDTPDIQAMKAQGKTDLQSLDELSGDAYARSYIKAMVEGHQKALDLIDSKMLPAASTDAVKNHLTTTRSAVEAHLTQAKQIQSTLK